MNKHNLILGKYKTELYVNKVGDCIVLESDDFIISIKEVQKFLDLINKMSSKYCCPECAEFDGVDVDHNSLTCHKCKQTWALNSETGELF